MSEIRFHLKGQIPSGKNAIIITRSGQRFPTARFKKWREDAMKQMMAIGNLKVPADWNPVVDIIYTPGDRRRRDVPGMVDALWHVMEKFGLVDDDARLRNVRWMTTEVMRETPGVSVWITDLRAEAPSASQPAASA